MSYRDYAKLCNYKLFETPEAVVEELKEIAMHYEALEDKNREKYKNIEEKNLQIFTWADILIYRNNWFTLSILGINLPKYFINAALVPAFKDDAFNELSPHMKLIVIALTLLFWVEINESEIPLAKHQKELLILLIDTLLSKEKIDERLFEGPINIIGFEKADFTRNYINSVLSKLAGFNIQFKNPS